MGACHGANVSLGACGKEPAPPAPTTVNVRLNRGIEPTFDAKVRAAVAKEVAEWGFTVVDGESAATVSIDIDGRRERAGLVDAMALHAFELTLHAKMGGASGDFGLELAREDRRLVDVANWAFEHAVDTTATAAVSWLAMQPAIKAEVDRNQQTRGERASPMLRTRSLAEAREDHVKAYSDFCKAEAARTKAMDEKPGEGLPKVTCMGDPCAQWTLLGLGTDGVALVQDTSRTPTFGMVARAKPTWTEAPERILRVAIGKDTKPEVIFRAANIYGFGTLSPDGKRLALSAFAGGRQAMVMLDPLTGKALGKATVLEEGQRVGWTMPMPGDGPLLGQSRDGVALYSATGPKVLEDADEAWPTRTGMLVKFKESGLLSKVDARGETVLSVPWDAEIDEVVEAADGSLYMTQIIGRNVCNVAHLSGDKLALLGESPLEACLWDLAMLGDGRLAATSDVTRPGDVPGDREVVVVDPATGKVTALTADELVEEALQARGDRVVFSRRLGDWPPENDMEIYRRQLCWIDVPKAP